MSRTTCAPRLPEWPRARSPADLPAPPQPDAVWHVHRHRSRQGPSHRHHHRRSQPHAIENRGVAKSARPSGQRCVGSLASMRPISASTWRHPGRRVTAREWLEEDFSEDGCDMFGPERAACPSSTRTRHSRVRRHRWWSQAGFATRLLGCRTGSADRTPSRSSAGFANGPLAIPKSSTTTRSTSPLRKKVGWLDVAVHDSALVRATQRLCHAAHQDQRFSKLQGRPTEAVRPDRALPPIPWPGRA